MMNRIFELLYSSHRLPSVKLTADDADRWAVSNKAGEYPQNLRASQNRARLNKTLAAFTGRINLLSAVILTAIVALSVPSRAQTVVTPHAGMVIGSDSNIKLSPGYYSFLDTNQTGIIQIVGVHDVVLDGDSVTLNGTNYTGYGIVIRNSSNVQIRNFTAIDSFFYAIRIDSSSNVTVNGCDLSYNKNDTSGWLNVWTDVGNANGGGVLVNRSEGANLSHNVMKYSNDGIAMYHCASDTILNNDLSYNTAYAIRMFFSDSNDVENNQASHVYRENPVNSDAGAILLIVSNDNRVVNNDFSYSSDGIFLGQYQYSQIPNDNYFAYNNCSNSPHNAIEATFADGNVYEHNKADSSCYGFWLGYSFNTIVDSNEVIANHQALSVGTDGIAIDRGYNNTITNNVISGNVAGIALWEGTPPVTGYESQLSANYTIAHNTITDNTTGIDVTDTQNFTADSNDVSDNGTGISLSGGTKGCVLHGNTFSRTISYYIQNNSSYPINATANSFSTSDTSYIEGKIFDHQDDSTKGVVNWVPFVAGPAESFEIAPPNDMTEPGSSDWMALASDGMPTTVSWDSTTKMTGSASLKVVTQSGFDVNIHRWPPDNKIASWNLTGRTILNVSFYAENTNSGGFQNFSIRLGNDFGGYFEYDASASLLTNAIGQWQTYEIPLKGNSTWKRTTVGTVSMNDISYVEIHPDTWGYGFTLWIDNLSFFPLTAVTDKPALPKVFSLDQNYPNPFNPATMIEYQLPTASHVVLKVYDVLGRAVANLVDQKQDAGTHFMRFDASKFPSGVYFCRLIAGDWVAVKKMVVLK